ncbi:TetR family transcriptional regulator [Phytohabitans sp. ZYX-F-186]|uniref:TetR family transcriptional regulator n=1 Tax=Phytohabitans maris TaxID=3071409 RepID=A0ABU0ZG67_9ACTN|nr:TetR family transcriptional regulator [Phytohabitans sp. ZYX-F-186]MDQ7905394.1 TetR family transcriptional regulator [Phytohabitans sp. ZYX-F-186]
MNDPGLRERKKAATRAALTDAAIRLAQERGVEHVTAEAIADAAGVSPRTFHNYFANKEEAILAAMWDFVREVVAAIRARPARESAMEAMRHVADEMIATSVDSIDDLATRMRLMDNSPTLSRRNDALKEEVGRSVIEALAERSGTDPDRDLYPRLLTASLHAALIATIEVSRGDKTGRSLADLLTEAFDQLAAGLREPLR